MDTLYFLSRFLYRIRYPLIFGTLAATLLAIYFTQFLPRTFVVTTTVFTGITSKPALDDMSSGADWNYANNAHDNIINLVRSKSTLQSISMSLLAQHLIYGDPDHDNQYITSQHYRELIKIVPEDIIALVDKDSLERTVANFAAYRTEDRNNFIYALFSWDHKHYSYVALSKIRIRRMQSSDMIEISYECDDPGIAANTVSLLNKELADRWEGLLLSTSNDVVGYFEEQLTMAENTLHSMEDSLVLFNTEYGIINYEEQTKHLAALNNIFETRYDEIQLENKSSRALLDQLERQMNTRVKLLQQKETLLETLDEISTLNGKISEVEIFGGTDQTKNATLEVYRKKLAEAEKRIDAISTRMDEYQQSKEGVAITEMVDRWLEETIRYGKSTEELKFMDQRRKEIDEQYKFFSPVGPNLNRMDRSVRVAEESYLTILHHLGLAKLKQKNILLNSGTLQVVTPPEFPLLSVPTKRKLYVLAAMVGAAVFIFGLYLLLEMLDRTLRNKRRTENLTGGKVIGAMPRPPKMRYRRYADQIRRMATGYLAGQITGQVSPTRTVYINVLSLESGEGKSYVIGNLCTFWEEMGFSVRSVIHEEDFQSESKKFLTSTSPADLSPEGMTEADIVLTEFQALKIGSVPASMLEGADFNLVVLSAQRPWKDSDKTLFDNLKGSSDPTRTAICLTMADREAVQEIVGQLPPYTRWRSLFFKWFNFGITAHRA